MQNDKADIRRLLKLFLSMLYISAFTYGGGYVIVSLMKKKFVDELQWLTEEEMLDYTALAQSTPGAIAVNAAILVGAKMAGLGGMLIAVLGTIIPPIAILSIISLAYEAFAGNAMVALVLRGMQAGVAAVILDVVCSLGAKVIKTHSRLNMAVMAIALIAAVVFKVNVVLIILAAALTGVSAALVGRRKEGTRDAA